MLHRVFTNIWAIIGVHTAKYFSTMEHMGHISATIWESRECRVCVCVFFEVVHVDIMMQWDILWEVEPRI